jgi:hypothetical protein
VKKIDTIIIKGWARLKDSPAIFSRNISFDAKEEVSQKRWSKKQRYVEIFYYFMNDSHL